MFKYMRVTRQHGTHRGLHDSTEHVPPEILLQSKLILHRREAEYGSASGPIQTMWTQSAWLCTSTGVHRT
jgi:hypothetical protein